MEEKVQRKRTVDHIWQRDEHDFYVEPEWVSEALFRIPMFLGTIFDPACGTGRILSSAKKAGYSAMGADIVDRGCAGASIANFLSYPDLGIADPFLDNIVCNPPFGLAREFVELALKVTRYKTAMLLPAKWVCGDTRSRWLESTPLWKVLFITPRPSMPPGAVIEAGMPVGGGTEDFAWYIWSRGHPLDPELGWLRRDP